MDSKKRHELETNDLREFLDNFKDFWDKNGNSILIVLIVVVGGFAGMRWYKNSKATKVNEASVALESATNAQYLLTVAQDHPSVAHIALCRAGDAFLEEARLAQVAGEGVKEATGRASEAYTRVYNDEGNPIEFRIHACDGLATAAEMNGEWDKARGYYEQARELAGDRFPFLAAMAQQKHDAVDALANPIAFGPDEPDPVAPGPGAGLPFDPDDVDGDGTPDLIQRPDEPAGPSIDPLFPEDGPALPGLPDGDDGDAPAIDPLLDPAGGE